MYYTTLNKIRSFSPCKPGWKKLLSSLGKAKGDDERLSMKKILDSNGVDDAIWCIRTLEKEIIINFALYCAEAILPIFEDKYTDDYRPRKAIEAAKNRSQNNDDDINAAYDAASDTATAYATAYASNVATDIDAAIAYAAYTASYAAAFSVNYDSADDIFYSTIAAVSAAEATVEYAALAATTAGLNITKRSLFEQYFCQ